MTLVVFLVGSLVVRAAALKLSVMSEIQGFGLTQLTPMPEWAEFGAGFLLMDLTFYWWHRANHEVVLLWRFHNVHHIDPDLDVSTSFRFHLVEVLYSTGFRVAQVGLIGVAPLTYAVYETVFSCGTVFHHSNWRLPLGVERAVNKVFVTPRMHGIHHSAVREETNSNYSVVFRWWDMLHGTLRLGVPHSEVDIGVPAYQLPGDNGLASLMAAPFAAQREYWRYPDGRLRVIRGATPVSSNTTTMME
jgi:sterol desaturase/sphingolipid hydroxylase (fatty acid hydroxylase superfamily)